MRRGHEEEEAKTSSQEIGGLKGVVKVTRLGSVDP